MELRRLSQGKDVARRIKLERHEQELKRRIARILSRIAPETDIETVDPEESLQQALDIDSFDYLNFLVAIRDELGVTIEESDYPNVRTLSGLLRYLQSRTS